MPLHGPSLKVKKIMKREQLSVRERQFVGPGAKKMLQSTSAFVAFLNTTLPKSLEIFRNLPETFESSNNDVLLVTGCVARWCSG